MTKPESIKAMFTKERVLTENSDQARELFNQSTYGKILTNGSLQLSLLESTYLLEKEKIHILDGKNCPITFDQLLQKTQRLEKMFWTKYCVYRDIRERGYIIKTALKFGAEFRVYDRGVKPGGDHARWIVFPVNESQSLTWHDFSAKNRVAHSTKKRLLIAVVDEENDVSYWECRWLRP